MDKNVHPLAATLFLVILLTGAGVWFWGTGQAKEYGGPAGLTVNPDNHLFIQINNQLIEHDQNGVFVRRHNLGELGVELLLGGTAFFSNGDILLRRGPDTRTLWDNIRAYQRKTNQSPLTPDAEGAGLYRCNLESGNCSSFADPAIDLKSAFSAFIEPGTDVVYISDSSRHLVRKYSANGVELAPPAEGFRFPNQLMINDGVLLVADTNHHRIRAVELRDAEFGVERFTASVVPGEASGNDQRWPSHFVRAGDKWWVNNMKTGMNYGGIYAFDDDWRFTGRIDLPDLQDPIGLVRFNNEVLISDWYGDRVHRVSLSGEPLGDYYSEGLADVLDEFGVERLRYNIYAWSAAGLALLLSLAILAKGTDWTGKTGRKDDPEDPLPADEPLLLVPDPKNVKKMRSSLRSARYLMLPLVAATIGLIWFAGLTSSAIQIGLSGLGFFALFYVMDWMTRVNTETSICLDGDRIILRIHTGREARVSAKEVFFSESVVATDDMAIFLGQHQTPLYDRKKVVDALRSRLPATQEVSHWAMQKKLIAMRHPFGLVLVLVAATMIVLGLLFLFE